MPKRSNKKPSQALGASSGAAVQTSSRPKTDVRHLKPKPAAEASASKHGFAAAKRPRTGKADAKEGVAKPRHLKGSADEAGEGGKKGPKGGKFGPKRRQPLKGPKEQDIWNSDVALDTAVLEVASKKAGVAAAVTPAIELLRLRKAKMLRSLMHKECKAANVKVPILGFERWLTRCKLEDSKEGGGSKEPLLPEEARLDMGLVRDLVRGKMKEPEARKLVTKLSESSAKAAKRLISASKPGAADDDQDGKGGSGLPEAAPIEVSTTPLTKDLAMGTEKPYLQVNHAHYKKLQRLFVRYGLGRTGEAAEAKLTPGENEDFHTRLFCLLARYQALGGHGYQAALSEHGFRVLQKRMETQFECFASPLNCHFGRYCSAFPDTDCVFGSLGSFFSFRPTSGSYEANPPFVPEFMSAMTEHMEALLKKAKGPLSFTVIIPAWKEIHAWDQLESSKFRKTTWTIPASSHIYCDGAQHMRPDRYRPSSFDTAVIFLQNEKGHEKWPPSDEIKEELEEAMKAALSQSAPTIAAYEKKMHRKGKTKKGRPRPDASAGDDGEDGASKAKPSKKRRLTSGKSPSSSTLGAAGPAPADALE